MADKFEQLKGKYQTVLKKIEQLGVRLENLHLQDDKLFIRGHAKSQRDSNEVWNQIKLVDPSYQNDLMAELSYDQAAAPAPAAPKAQPQSQERTYTVQKGDTLSRIAKALYGDSSLYRKIFEANRDKLSDPDKIMPGQILVVPA